MYSKLHLFISLLSVLCSLKGFAQETMGVITNSLGEVIAYEDETGRINRTSAISFFQTDTVSFADSTGVINPVLGTRQVSQDEIKNAFLFTVIYMNDETALADPAASPIAYYHAGSKQLRYMDNQVLFAINNENRIVNNSGSVIGWIEVDGSIYGADGNKLGKGTGIEFFKLVYFFFYSNK